MCPSYHSDEVLQMSPSIDDFGVPVWTLLLSLLFCWLLVFLVLIKGISSLGKVGADFLHHRLTINHGVYSPKSYTGWVYQTGFCCSFDTTFSGSHARSVTTISFTVTIKLVFKENCLYIYIFAIFKTPLNMISYAVHVDFWLRL